MNPQSLSALTVFGTAPVAGRVASPKHPHRESNPDLKFRRPASCPLDHVGMRTVGESRTRYLRCIRATPLPRGPRRHERKVRGSNPRRCHPGNGLASRPIPSLATFQSFIVRVPPGNYDIPAHRLRGGCSSSELRRHGEVGLAGFEPTTSASRTRRATKLRYNPLTTLLRDRDSNPNLRVQSAASLPVRPSRNVSVTVERLPRIELGPRPWHGRALPLSHNRENWVPLARIERATSGASRRRSSF